MKQESSFQINNQLFIKTITDDLNFPYLISFPRTGSHWLRVLMELYFKKPSLVRVFFYYDAKVFTCMHRHDDDLSIVRKNVIYLYRHPVPTVFSQLKYYGQDIGDNKIIEYWTIKYREHLTKWLVEEQFVEKKVILTYEGMKDNLAKEFKKICKHLGEEYDHDKLLLASEQATKNAIKRKTSHDEKVVTLGVNYDSERKDFATQNENKIMGIIFEDGRLVDYF